MCQRTGAKQSEIPQSQKIKPFYVYRYEIKDLDSAVGDGEFDSYFEEAWDKEFPHDASSGPGNI